MERCNSMNVLQIFVKIHKAERKESGGYSHLELIADTDCGGCIERNKRIIVSDDDYKSILKYGYYLG